MSIIEVCETHVGRHDRPAGRRAKGERRFSRAALGVLAALPLGVSACVLTGSGTREPDRSGTTEASGGQDVENPDEVPPGRGEDGNGAGGADTAGCAELPAIVRDFRASHPDFEGAVGRDPYIVRSTLGPDGKPVYAGAPVTTTTHGREAFNQWFRDVAGVNTAIPISIPLEDNGDGTRTYASPKFFPIDGEGFGNEGLDHNFHFTVELRTKFTYEGGELFTFTGDDDCFVFINGRLAIELGGVHGPESSTADLDAQAEQLGIVPGKTYSLDLFFAERHTSGSKFYIDTTIRCFSPG